METRELVQLAVNVLSNKEGGKRVALYVDMAMVDGPTGCFLPVMNVEGDDGVYAPFPPQLQEQIAMFFGPDYEAADELVAELNAENGIDKDAARDIVMSTMFPSYRARSKD